MGKDATETHAEIGTWIEMDDRTDYKFEGVDIVRVSIDGDDDLEDERLIGVSLGQRYGGTWTKTEDWQTASGEPDVTSVWTRGVSDDQIRALKEEAAIAGDLAQVELCALALSGDVGARRKCVDAIADAKAMNDTENE